MASRKKPLDFEHSLAELEALVEALEAGNLPLEDSLKAFETGIRITRTCQQAIREAEQKVNLLCGDLQGEAELQPFAGDDDN